MTDRFAALTVLGPCRRPLREEALTSFEKRYRDVAAGEDKWFALQATIPEAGTVVRVQLLMKHKAFSLSNPNRARFR